MHTVSNPSLKSLNTFRIDVRADELIEIQEEQETHQVISRLRNQKKPYLILGGGSNVLFTKDFDGVIVLNRLTGRKLLKEDENHVWISGMSGESWHDFVMFTIDSGWQGLENLSLIPGSLGAAPVQNIGAYGMELKDIFDSLKAINMYSGEEKTFSKDDCKFGYRDSYFKNETGTHYFITEVNLRLNKTPDYNLSYGPLARLKENKEVDVSPITISREVMNIRNKKLPDPDAIGNAGSFFKNPIVSDRLFEKIEREHPDISSFYTGNNSYKISAGWLVEQCGWKGYRIGDAGVYKDQSLVLVNYGNASGKEVWELAQAIQKDVFKTFGIKLEAEVRVF